MQDQQGRIVCMGDEYLSQVESGYFHTVFIDTDIHSTITFQLVKEIKFRIRDAQTADEVRTGDCFVTVQLGWEWQKKRLTIKDFSEIVWFFCHVL